MAIKDSVLNFVIKAKNLAGDVLSKFGKDIAGVDSTSEAAAKSVDALGKASDNLGDATSGASAAAKSLDKSLDSIDDKAGAAASAATTLREKIKGISNDSLASGKAADKAAASIGKMGQRYDAAGNPIETTRQEIKSTNNELDRVDGASAKAGTSIGSLTKRLLAMAAAAIGINTVKNALADMLNTGDKFERLSLQMNQTMGSIADGEKATAWVKDFAKNTPLQLDQVTETFVRLKNFGLDPQAGTMQAIVDQAAKLGKGYEAVEGISLALGQAWAKQKLQGEEIMQLIERGVPVWDLLAKVTGKNTAELQKMSEAGQLGKDTIKALIDEMGKQSTGAAAQNMSLLSGYISNLKDEWSLFLNEIAQSGALDYAKGQLRQLIAYIQELKTTGQLKEFAQQISDGFIAISEASKSVVLAIKDNIGTIGLLAKAYAAVKLVEFASSAKNLALTLGTTLVGSTTAAAGALGVFAKALRAAPWVLVIDQVGKLVQTYGGLVTAKGKLEAAQAGENKAQDDAITKMQEFNEQTGLNVQSLEEIINLQKSGAIFLDEYTGKWRLATNQITEAEKAERANTDAQKKAVAERTAYKNQLDDLAAKFEEVKDKSKDASDAIVSIGQKALETGGGGMDVLATVLQSIAFEGKATSEELQNGLGKLLLGLNDAQYQKFAPSIIAALDKIKTGTQNTTAVLGGMKKVISEELTAAAAKLGIDLAKVFTGLDKDSVTGIGALTDLGHKLAEAGIKGKEADDAIREGLLKTLKGLDTTKEIDATIASLTEMVKTGELSGVAFNGMLGTLLKLRNIVVNGGKEQQDSQQKLGEENKKTAGTWGLISVEANNAAHEMSEAGSIAKWVQDQYKALRDEVVALGPAAAAAFDQLQKVNPNTEFLRDEFGDLKQAIADSTNEIERLQQVSTAADFTGINRFLQEAAINAELVKKEYAEQKLALEQLQKAYAAGAISAQQFINSARGASSSTSLLNDADLSALRNQIKAAQEQMESLRDSTLGTLNSLESELANLQGNAERVAQLAYESRLADLNAKLDEAKKSGDKEAITNAQEALRIAKEIYDIKKQQLADDKKAAEEAKAAEAAAKAEAAAQAAKEQQAQQQASAQQQTIQQQPATGSVQRLEIKLPNNKTASLSGTADDVNNLLEFLNQAGMRSLQ